MSCPFAFFFRRNTTSTPHSASPEVPTRRTLLKGMLGVAGASLASNVLASPQHHLPQSDHSDNPYASAQGRQPFEGLHQSGIATPQQAYISLVAFDVIATNKTELKSLLQTLTARCRFLMEGGAVPQRNPKYPPLDSGILGPTITSDNLTITVSVGASLFDQRYELAAHKPRQLITMKEFPNDGLLPDWCHGDLVLQICANSPDTTAHALRDIIKHTPSWLLLRWRKEGFISAHDAQSQGTVTPRNMLGFKDGTVNPPASQPDVMNRTVWVTPDQHEPAWTLGGCYQAIRLIRFYVERWDRTPLQEQQTIFGRERDNGAPLGLQHEHDDPDYASDPNGKRIPLDAHMRLANPRTAGFDQYLLLRRGYSYSDGISPSGQLNIGLLFISYQANLQRGFIDIQQRLNGEPLEEYIKPFGGGYYFTLPGVTGAHDYLGKGLLEA